MSTDAPIDVERYNRFVTDSLQGTLFSTTWWLDTVAPGQYHIPMVERGGSICAAWPLVTQKGRLNATVITMPPLTPWLGISYAPNASSKETTRLANEKDWAIELIEQLPAYSALLVRFHRSFDYWLPLYWNGFTQTTRYTFVIQDLANLDDVWAGFKENARTDIRKAQRQDIVVECSNDPDEFWQLHRLTFARQKLPMPYSEELLRKVDTACQAHNVRRIFLAKDRAGRVHAGAYVVWDEKSAYYLLGGGDPEKRNSGATSLVIWEAIRFAATVTHAFDFEGSMMEPVERFFRSFGAKPCAYSLISKENSPARIMYHAVRDALKLARAGRTSRHAS